MRPKLRVGIVMLVWMGELNTMTGGYDRQRPSLDFPDPAMAMDEGLVAVGGRLDIPTLYQAYKKGIFPWPQVGYPMLWFSPDRRGIIEFSEVHIPRSLEKERKKQRYHFTLNRCFPRVIEECRRQPRKLQSGTWIVPELMKAYLRFHEAGFVHSVEVWQEEKLVGGIYGVFVEGVFSGESMFHHVPNASKLALLFLIDHLSSLGMTWMDIQMVTPVTESIGGKYISRADFLTKIQVAQTIWNRKRFHF